MWVKQLHPSVASRTRSVSMKNIKLVAVILFGVAVIAFSKGVDDNLLCANIVVTKDYIAVGARGGLQPYIYYRAYGYEPFAVIQKNSDEDPGKIVWALYDKNGSILFDEERFDFITESGDGESGEKPPAFMKKFAEEEGLELKPMSALVQARHESVNMRLKFVALKDADNLSIILADVTTKEDIKKLLPLTVVSGATTIFKKNTLFKKTELVFVDKLVGVTPKEAYRLLKIPVPSSVDFQRKQCRENVKSIISDIKSMRDIDNVLKSVEGLQTTGKTDGFKEGYAEGGDEGLEDLLMKLKSP